jgi:hypothetical protein
MPLSIQASGARPQALCNDQGGTLSSPTSPLSGGSAMFPPRQHNAAGVISLAAIGGRLHSQVESYNNSRNAQSFRSPPPGAIREYPGTVAVLTHPAPHRARHFEVPGCQFLYPLPDTHSKRTRLPPPFFLSSGAAGLRIDQIRPVQVPLANAVALRKSRQSGRIHSPKLGLNREVHECLHAHDLNNIDRPAPLTRLIHRRV